MVVSSIVKLVATPRGKGGAAAAAPLQQQQQPAMSSDTTSVTPRKSSILGSFTSRLRGSWRPELQQPSILSRVPAAPVASKPV